MDNSCENAVYRAINPLPGIPNRSNLIQPNVNMEKIGGTQDVEAEKNFTKLSPAPFFKNLSVLNTTETVNLCLVSVERTESRGRFW